MSLFSNPTPASLSLRVLARLLSYPDAQLRGDLIEMRQALLSEKAIASARLDELNTLINALARGNALDNEAEYVEVFDRGRATSLHHRIQIAMTGTAKTTTIRGMSQRRRVSTVMALAATRGTTASRPANA